jgi:hypothetical protein
MSSVATCIGVFADSRVKNVMSDGLIRSGIDNLSATGWRGDPAGTIIVSRSYLLSVHTYRLLALVVASAVCSLPLTACSDDSGGSDDVDANAPVRVEVTQKGGEVTTSQDVVKADRGQNIELVVSSDAADEFHVHSEPEHEFEIEVGDDQTFTFSIDTAGQYEMESHELEVTILKLQIS